MTTQQFLQVKPILETVPTTARQSIVIILNDLAVPLVVTTILTITSVNPITIVQLIAAFLLLLLPWAAYQRWVRNYETGLPVFALVSGFHWLYFAVALFWGNRRIPVWYNTNSLLSDEAITAVLLMAFIGMISLGFGLRVKLFRLPIATLTQISGSQKGFWDYIRFVLVVGVVLNYLPNIVYIFGEAGRQWIIALQSTVPLFAAVLLLRRYFQGSATGLDKALILFYIGSQILTGLGSGWIGSLFYLGIALGLVYLLEKRRIPIMALIIVILVALFLEVGKYDFRAQYWYGDSNAEPTLLNRISFWLEGSSQGWQQIFADSSGELLVDHLRKAMLRVSLLTHAANVYERTPDIVPFQGTKLYEFTVVGFVPRFLWPEKPSGNDANRYYQVAYDITPADRLHTVSIAIGYLVEAYISFGWAGIGLVMFLMGSVVGSVSRSLFHSRDNLIASSIGVIAVLSLLRVESQMGLYLVSTIQAVVVAILVLLPLIVIRQPRSR